jgi:hypothetical protein
MIPTRSDLAVNMNSLMLTGLIFILLELMMSCG